jgi:hypothetical protein
MSSPRFQQYERIDYDDVDFRERGGIWIIEKTNPMNAINGNWDRKAIDLSYFEDLKEDEDVVKMFDSRDAIEIWAYSPYDSVFYYAFAKKIYMIVSKYHKDTGVWRGSCQHVAILMKLMKMATYAQRHVDFHAKIMVGEKGDDKGVVNVSKTVVAPYSDVTIKYGDDDKNMVTHVTPTGSPRDMERTMPKTSPNQIKTPVNRPPARAWSGVAPRRLFD